MASEHSGLSGFSSRTSSTVRAALYARFSTEMQRKESIDDQYRACERVAAANGLEIVARFADEAISGGVADRPGYRLLLDAARAGQFDCIIAEDISRLWRSRAEFGPRSAELEDLNVGLITCVGDDTRRDGYGLILGIKSAIAEHYRREISYRTRRGMEGLAAAGKSCGGRCYGYGSPDEADTVRWLYGQRASGVGINELCLRLNGAGTPAPRGARWSYNSVKRILCNPRYAGEAIWGATFSRTRAQDGRRGKPLMQPQPLVQRHDPALQLVDSVLWRACNPDSTVV